MMILDVAVFIKKRLANKGAQSVPMGIPIDCLIAYFYNYKCYL